uniref:Asparagine synthetase domain-containing protein n=1 Tax=Panagrolaimus sp. JU765 TaxID=591449 RepID=A0AC34QCT2_9BILA
MEGSATRNGINYNDHEMKKLMLQFTFKDLYMAECHLFYFVKNEAVTMFKERLQNSIEMVTMIPVFGCNDLLEINQEILPEEEVQMMLENTVEEFIDLFKKIMPRYLSIRLQQTTEKISSPLLFLFSGGVDSLFVAMMASCMAEEKYEFVLVNVSFSEDGNDFELAPDRKRGFAAYNFLKERFPERVFHFLRVDVTKDELQRERTSSIAKAISPGSSVLDDSIGCVVWFASRARGTVDGIEKDYERATHVFVGSGSDEILGGYSRHRGRFQREGYEGLFDELRLELENIGNRNLGRDDRVALSNDRIILAPFLDEDVVRF